MISALLAAVYLLVIAAVIMELSSWVRINAHLASAISLSG
jgi:hypothetical protein